MSGYAIKFEGKTFTPNGKDDTIVDTEAHNKALEAQELELWAAKPDRWQVYVHDGLHEPDTKDLVTTWCGTKLGTIIARHAYRSNMSRNMVAIRFRATNGAIYYGRYGADWSQLCRVRKVKGT